MDLFSACAATSAFSDPLPETPMGLLGKWLAEAQAAADAPNPDSMVLATVDGQGEPSARVVLCKDLNCESGYLVFYTNYDSRKARELLQESRAAATFHWDHAGRQARLRGVVVRSPEAESDAYFATRPLLSQLGAWASRQSQTMATREQLIGQIAETMFGFGIDLEQVVEGVCERPIPRPPNWGGYRFWIRSVELWSGGPGRLHERILWMREMEKDFDPDPHRDAIGGAGPVWTCQRLQP